MRAITLGGGRLPSLRRARIWALTAGKEEHSGVANRPGRFLTLEKPSLMGKGLLLVLGQLMSKRRTQQINMARYVGTLRHQTTETQHPSNVGTMCALGPPIPRVYAVSCFPGCVNSSWFLSLSLGFLICKMGIIIISLTGLYKDSECQAFSTVPGT